MKERREGNGREEERGVKVDERGLRKEMGERKGGKGIFKMEGRGVQDERQGGKERQ